MSSVPSTAAPYDIVLRPHMPDEVAAPRPHILTVAVLAVKCLLARMSAHMHDEVAVLRSRVPAAVLLADIRLLARVRARVLHKRASIRRRVPAAILLTHKWLLARVRAHVHDGECAARLSGGRGAGREGAQGVWGTN